MRQRKSFHISLPKLLLSKRRLLFLLVIAILVGAIALLYYSFMINAISVSGLGKDETLQGLTPFYKKHIFLVSEDAVKSAITKNNPRIKSVTVQKQYPDLLKIQVTKNRPVAVLEVAEGYFLLAEDGRILLKERERSSTLPVIKYYQQFSFNAYKTGDYLNFNDIKNALTFVEALQTFSYTLDTIDIKGTNMIACNLIIGTSQSTILFSSEKESKQQVYEVTTILKKFAQDKKSFKRLDLRFNRPVVEF